MSSPITDPEAYLAEYQAKYQAALAAVPTMRTTQVVDTGDGPLVVNHVEYGVVPVEEVLAGTAAAETVTLTEDGRSANRVAWHEGPAADADWVRYERWQVGAGRVAHGFVHRGSRKLLQVG
ncbi:MAG TPA: hypothetical protein VMU09_11150 [Acidimicrobiales bacterium]|nr:hypothetical protein [Acidimicrobiales bacterium]